MPQTERKLIAKSLEQYLGDPHTLEIGDCLWVFGLLPIAVSSPLEPPSPIRVRIHIQEDWIVHPPRIWIAEKRSWLKPVPDWHVFPDRQVCYEFGLRWSEHFIRLLKTGIRERHDLAAQWITRATSYLLQVHYVCAEYGIELWPEKVVPSWAHGYQDALQQYEPERVANALNL